MGCKTQTQRKNGKVWNHRFLSVFRPEKLKITEKFELFFVKKFGSNFLYFLEILDHFRTFLALFDPNQVQFPAKRPVGRLMGLMGLIGYLFREGIRHTAKKIDFFKKTFFLL